MASSEKVLVIELSKSRENQKLLDGRPQTHGMRSGRVYLQPGQACGEHSTKDREEVLVFLSGRGELFIAGKERFNVGEGTISYIPPQTIHDVRNTGDGPLMYVYCVTPVCGTGEK
jgi:mannose-6-phosphate isomerase-like protein (cupin superfamily)